MDENTAQIFISLELFAYLVRYAPSQIVPGPLSQHMRMINVTAEWPRVNYQQMIVQTETSQYAFVKSIRTQDKPNAPTLSSNSPVTPVRLLEPEAQSNSALLNNNDFAFVENLRRLSLEAVHLSQAPDHAQDEARFSTTDPQARRGESDSDSTMPHGSRPRQSIRASLRSLFKRPRTEHPIELSAYTT